MQEKNGKKILSIQSHVVFGHVGNAAAAFPLERLGITVWRLNSVQFSNHLGYGDFEGEVVAPAQLTRLVEGLGRRGALAHCDALLTGFIGSAALGRVVVQTATRIKRENPAALYCCDPVMGDQGKGLYVEPALARLMADELVPLADILTPNLFELERLCGQPLDCLETLVEAARGLIAQGPSCVLVTSVPLGLETGEIGLVAVTADRAWRLVTPYLAMDPMPNGAGDAVAALFLGHLLAGRDPAAAMARAAASIFEILQATAAAGTRELQLIAAQESIVRPRRRFAPERLFGPET